VTEDELFAKSLRITQRIRLDVEKRRSELTQARAAGGAPKQKIDSECISVDEARGRYAFDSLQHLASGDGSLPVLLIKGDVTGSVTLNRTWVRRIAAPFKLGGDPACVLVDGAIDIEGDILDSFRADWSLLVTGRVSCDYLESRNGHMEIQGDLRATYGICGEYNDGSLTVGGQLLTPYIVANDHQLPREAHEESIYLEAGEGLDEIAIGQSTGSGWGWNWNYFEESNALVSEEVWDEEGTFSTAAFFELVRKGVNPFVKP
jgi:hypothetical protein